MKKILLLTGICAFVSSTAHPFPVLMPQGNLVQNGSFHLYWQNWSGRAAGFFGWSATVPNEYCALATDMYQYIPTTPGQSYSLTFYAAADLFLAPSVRINVDLNYQTLLSYDTPPYSYGGGDRYDQMHWQELTSSFVAATPTTRLEFFDVTTAWFGLAAVSVVPVPEPEPTSLICLASLAAIIVRPKIRGLYPTAGGALSH